MHCNARTNSRTPRNYFAGNPPFSLSANEKGIENEKVRYSKFKNENVRDSRCEKLNYTYTAFVSRGLTNQPLATRRDLLEVLVVVVVVVVVVVAAAFLATGCLRLAGCGLGEA